MEWFKDFLLQNFVLLFISIVIIVNGLYTFKKHPKISTFSLLIILCTLILAVSTTMEQYSKSIVNPTMTLVFSIIGYTLRPTCIYLFILLTIDTKNKLFPSLLSIPLVINLAIYLLSFNPEASSYIVYFHIADNGELSFGGGILRFTSHVISLGYILYLIYLSLSTITFKRVLRGVTTLSSSVAVIAAAVIESFLNSEGNIFILNTVISLSALFYYVYLVIEDNEVDHLTGLYNKERYYRDIDLNERNINGVAVFKIHLLDPTSEKNIEINNMKLEKAASNLIKSITRKMIVYRMEDDEFLLFTKGNKEMLDLALARYQIKMNDLEIHYTVSSAFKDNEKEPIRNLIFEAERVNKLKNLASRD